MALYIEATSQAFGTALCQRHGNGKRAVELTSKLVPMQHAIRHANELESLTIHQAVTERFWLYVQDPERFTIYTDNWTSTHLASKATLPCCFARIALDLSEHNFTIKHKKAKQNVVADTISRLSSDLAALVTMHAENSKLRNTQQQDPELALIIETITKPEASYVRMTMPSSSNCHCEDLSLHSWSHYST